MCHKPEPEVHPLGEVLPNGLGTDPPLPPDDPTIGYKFNHVMFRIRDPTRSLHFYINLMGMRTIFTLNSGPFTIYYIGYPQTTEHQSDFGKFARDTLPELQRTMGLIELFHIHGSENEPEDYYCTGNQPPHLGLGHFGFTVPDVPRALERLRSHGVEVVKDVGVSTRDAVPLSEWERQRGIGVGDLHQSYNAIFEQIAFVKDPVCTL
ncbi:unnamed protein product [Clonostachys rosea]|uniref:VOC domain-containing protein n=1 Tax=Bionectria ochroleuca TaxID=29856 RepID=A0ABY6U324_BIOOC|nr:unnamed protein product [Clonostachys rosea]